MNRRALLLGLAMWAIPFAVSVLVFPFHEPNRALFESIMAVTVTASAVGLGLVYFRKRAATTTGDGVALGVLWWVVCVLIDLPLFSAGPMQMPLAQYMADIGLTYVAIPVVTAGLAYAMASRTTGLPSE